MKKTITAISMALLMIFNFSCKDNDEVEQNPLLGVWLASTNIRTNCGVNGDDTANEGELDISSCESGCLNYKFLSETEVEGTYMVEDEKVTQNGTYTYVNGVLSVCFEYEDGSECNTGEMTIDQNSFNWFLAKDEPDVCDRNVIFVKQ